MAVHGIHSFSPTVRCTTFQLVYCDLIIIIFFFNCVKYCSKTYFHQILVNHEIRDNTIVVLNDGGTCLQWLTCRLQNFGKELRGGMGEHRGSYQSDPCGKYREYIEPGTKNRKSNQKNVSSHP